MASGARRARASQGVRSSSRRASWPSTRPTPRSAPTSSPGKDPFTVISSLNFFGNHFPIYEQAGINVVVGTPITVGDFTAPGVYSIGTGGGCLGVHTGMVYAATQELDSTKVAVPWADTPPGVVCYYDLEKKPLDVLNGSVPGDSGASPARWPTSPTSACRSSRRPLT